MDSAQTTLNALRAAQPHYTLSIPSSPEKISDNPPNSFINDANSRLLNSRQLSLESSDTFEENVTRSPPQKQLKMIQNDTKPISVLNNKKDGASHNIATSYPSTTNQMSPLTGIN